MTDKIQKTYQIQNGPSREELFDALRLFNERRQVTFDIIFKAQPWEQEDYAIMRHDGTRQSIAIYIYGITACRAQVIGDPIEGNEWLVHGTLCMGQDEEVPILAQYSTKTRTGSMIYHPDCPMTPGEFDGTIRQDLPPEEPGGNEGDVSGTGP